MLELARYHRWMNVESPLLQKYDPVEATAGLTVTKREDWISYVRHNTEPSAYHAIETCATMPLALGGIVDEHLMVYGVEGLRIVDASIMSVAVGANIAGTVHAIAEKAADLVKADDHRRNSVTWTLMHRNKTSPLQRPRFSAGFAVLLNKTPHIIERGVFPQVTRRQPSPTMQLRKSGQHNEAMLLVTRF